MLDEFRIVLSMILIFPFEIDLLRIRIMINY